MLTVVSFLTLQISMLPAKMARYAENERIEQLLFNDKNKVVNAEDGYDSDKGDSDSDEATKKSRKSNIQYKPAWHDEDDDHTTVGAALDAQGRKLPEGGINDRTGNYNKLLRQKFISTMGTPKWAKLENYCNNTDDEKILQTVGYIEKDSVKYLKKDIIESKKLTNLNVDTYKKESIINVIKFHPTTSAAIVAGDSGTLSLLAVNGKTNEKIHCVSFKNYPIHCGNFTSDGSLVYIGSNKPHFFIYDLMQAKSLKVALSSGITRMDNFLISPCGKFLVIAGRFGEIHVLCNKSKEILKTLKQNSDVTALCFNPESTKLFAHGSNGNVTVWDMSLLRVCHKWIDDGCVSGSSLAISPSGEFFATGSGQGVVNIYETKDILISKEPSPKKVLVNLTTKISGLQFNPHSEILAFYSAHLRNALRLAHIPSFQVYSNFPQTTNENFGCCGCAAFSPNSGYFSFGSNRKLAFLFRLKHYKNY